MANKKIDEMLDTIIKHEGGYVNNPNDNGGPTKYGVTQATLSNYLGKKATIDDVKNLTVEQAKEIFARRYLYGPRIDTLPEVLQPIVFDASVLYGQKRAIIFVQKIINEFGDALKEDKYTTDTDGVLGPQTRALITELCEKFGGWKINNAYVQERIQFCQAIVRNNPSQKVFIKGWTNRANSFLLKE